MAHELGHIVLRHHRELRADTLRRFGVKKTQYEILEEEANCFARNLLCPPASARALLRANGFTNLEFDETKKRNVWKRSFPSKDYLSDDKLLQTAFMLSPSAAKTRCHLLREDLANLLPQFRKNPLRIAVSAKWFCGVCGAPRLGSRPFCPECGGSRFKFLLKIPDPDPPQPLLYDGGHFRHCPFCGNSRSPFLSKFCSACGKPVANPCVPKYSYLKKPFEILENRESSHLCDAYAKYCPDCGNVTLFWMHTKFR